MKSFLCQLHLYGFTKVQCNSETSDSLDEFLAEAAAAPSAHSKLLFCHNPNFKRDDPHLLERCKQRVGRKRRATAAFSPGLALKENRPTRSPEVQPAGAAAAVKPH
ncbi:hypothetical protein QYF61_013882 [Mycteria americana]|uniref:HSF-type DNA-binding domain-containing protein n=1 Tax=Mycteria americana TaxID=33587 RepID=A0AAN7NSD5_MYCAM|nr:hypothetical protein QYF61_013882 [Mycteria americana]